MSNALLSAVILLVTTHMVILQNSESMVTEVRLIGSNENDRGTVQVKVNGIWNFICDDDFGYPEADAVCQDLGFIRAYIYTLNDNFDNYIRGEGREGPPLGHLNCSSIGNSPSDAALVLASCSFDTDKQHCERKEIAGVICNVPSPEDICPVEQYLCTLRNSLNQNVCVLREHQCDGISDCPQDRTSFNMIDNRSADEFLCGDVGVVRVGGDQQINSKSIRKRGGTVFIKHSGIWGTICDDNFGQEEAKVLCRNLGYGAGWAMAKEDAFFGRGSGKIWADGLLCTGKEGHIGDCPLISWGDTDCSHSEDAGLICYDNLESVRLVSKSGHVVAGGEQATSTTTDAVTGRLELKMTGVWGPVCATSFDHKDAKVLCRMLGFSGVAEAHHNGEYGRGTGPLFDDRFDCLGNETNLQECSLRLGNCTELNGSQRSHTSLTCSNRASNVDLLLRQQFPDKCGQTIDASNVFVTSIAKLRGGVREHRYASPWLAALVTKIPSSKDYIFFCGGVILSEDLVLTAAHCFSTRSPYNVKVRVGEYNRGFQDDGQEEFDIDKLWIHDQFVDFPRVENDIAIIKIQGRGSRGIRFNGRVQPICLPSIDLQENSMTNCQAYGWGKSHILFEAAIEPRVGKVKILPRNVCETYYYANNTNLLTPDMICTGDLENKVNPCQGDSGGPVTCTNSQGQQVVVGIISWGLLCDSLIREQPAFAASITHHLPWILKTIQRHEDILERLPSNFQILQ